MRAWNQNAGVDVIYRIGTAILFTISCWHVTLMVDMGGNDMGGADMGAITARSELHAAFRA